jgi:hypothetical protein
MALLMVLALALATQESAPRNVRTVDSKILALIDAGISGSATFRGLIATLNESDVIVYIAPKLSRNTLGGYFAHNIVSRGQFRYVRIAIDITGPEHRLVPVLAHELQHAVEVALSPDARDAQSVEQLFSRLAVAFGCAGSNCFETRAAKEVEEIVSAELEATRRSTRPGPACR